MTATRIEIAKAHPLMEPTPDTVIYIGPKTCPELYKETSQLQQDYYQVAGETLEKALWVCLPGGTYDQLLAAMHARKASQYRVRFPREET